MYIKIIYICNQEILIMKPKYNIQIRQIKVSKNTVESYLQVALNAEPIIQASVKGNKSIPTHGIPIGDAWVLSVLSKKDIPAILGDFWDKRQFEPITKKVYHLDKIQYDCYLEYKRLCNIDPDDPEADEDRRDYMKTDADEFVKKYKFLFYGSVQKRHARQKRRKTYFKPKMVQIGTDAEVNEALEYWKTFYKS